MAREPHREHRRKEVAMTLSNSPLAAGSGWVGWVVVAVVVIAFWAVTIVATLALFPTRRGKTGAKR
jgi:hypothetical protein